MLKITLLVLIAMSIPITALAEPMITLNTSQTEIDALDTVFIDGKVTGVMSYKPVNLTVTSPDGVVVYSPSLPINQDGTFKWIVKPTLPSFQNGVYTVTASNDDVASIAKIQFTVIGSTDIPKVSVPKSPDSGMIDKKPSAITLATQFEFGSNKLLVTGTTTSSVTDITFRITSPNGNLISVAQLTPGPNGEFSTEIKTGGPLWKENGFYTITANQGLSSEHKQSIKVEIENGVVVPEFGTIAVMILAVALVSIIVVSSKSRLVIPRY
ncbi:conserved exported hypothetical protein [metagenome]